MGKVRTEVRSVSDAMSRTSHLTISIPPLLTEFCVAEIEAALASLHNHKKSDLEEIKQELLSVTATSDPPEDFSRSDFLRRIGLSIRAMEEIIDRLPDRMKAEMSRAVQYAFRAGGLSAEMRIREANYYAVATFREVVEGGERGARKRNGSLAPHTARVLEHMIKRLETNPSVNAAARYAFEVRSCGTSVAANRMLYRAYLTRLEKET